MSFPLNWTETGADQQSNNWGTLLRNWALAQHDTEGAHGALTLTSGSVSGDLSVMGKLGVGTASPSFPVDIQETNATTNVRITDNVNGARLRLTAATVNVDIYNSGGSGQIGTQTNHNFAFVTNNATRGSISNAGLWSIGLPASSLNAAAFDVLLQNNSNIRGANAGGTNTHQLIGINASDQVVIATGTNNVRLATGGGLVQVATAVTSGAGGGDLILSNNASYRNVNAAGTGTQIVARVGTSNQIQLGPDAVSGEFFAFGAPGSVVNATQGDLVLQNTKALRGSNAAASAALIMIDLNGTNQVRLAPDGGDILWGRANVALGGGAAPTLGTIGGAGPAAAAQRAWLRVIESDGTASFIPIWR